MDEAKNARSSLVEKLWEEHLKGGVTLSEFSTFLARDAEMSFTAGADLSTIFVACAAIETHLRFECADAIGSNRTFSELVSTAGLPPDMQNEVDKLRKFRNRWVHVRNPANDYELQVQPEIANEELKLMSELAIYSMIRVFCSNQWV